MFAQANLFGDLRHVKPANQPGTNARHSAFAPLRMQAEQRLRHDESQDSVAEKLEALVVGRSFLFADISLGELMGQRTMCERAQEQLWARKLVPQSSLKLFEISFHSYLAVESFSLLDAFNAPHARRR